MWNLARRKYRLAMIIFNGLGGQGNDAWRQFLLRGLYDPRLFLWIWAFAGDFNDFSEEFDGRKFCDEPSSDDNESDYELDSFVAAEEEEEDGHSSDPSVDQVDAADESGASSSSSSKDNDDDE